MCHFITVFRHLAERYLAQINSTPEEETVPQQKIGMSKY